MNHVLIVDDEPHVTRVLRLALERGGFDVRTECDGHAALESVLADPPTAIVTDIQMPRLDGREFIRLMHELLPGRSFPVIVMTSMTAREEREWVRAIPDVEFLEKPVSPRQLLGHLTHRLGAQGIPPGGNAK